MEIRLREAVTLENIASGALRMVVQDENDSYFDAFFVRTDSGIQVYYVNPQTVIVGYIAAFDGTKKNIELVFADAGLTIVDILVTSSMPEVVMYPSVLNENVEQAVMLFRERMPKQALVDGALEMYVESERWGNQYIYPNVDDRNNMDIKIDGNAYFSVNNIQPSNKNLIIYKTSAWRENLKFSQPNRLAWMEGYTLLDAIDGTTLEDVTVIEMVLSSDKDNRKAVLSQEEGKIVRSFTTDQSLQPVALQFSGGLSQQTIFRDYPKPENMIAIPLRLELYNEENVSLFPLYAIRKNNYMDGGVETRLLKAANGSDYAVVGTPSPVLINVI